MTTRTGFAATSVLILATLTAGAGASPTASDVAKAYAAFDFSVCEKPGSTSCEVRFADFAGLRTRDRRGEHVINPRALMSSVDPEWLPGWGRIKSDDGSAWTAIKALATAAARKSWLARCHADFGKHDVRTRDAEKRLANAIAELDANSNPYARLAGLLALRKHPDAAGSIARFSLERAIVAAFRATDREFLYDEQSHAPGGVPMRARQDVAFERDLYCVDAMQRGTDLTPRAPHSGKLTAYDKNFRPFDPVRELIPRTREAELITTVARLREAAHGELARGRFQHDQHPGLIKHQEHASDSDPMTVASVKQDGAQTIVELTATRETSNEVDCKEIKPRKVVRVEDGVVYYAHRCKTEKIRYDLTDVVTFDALPPGVSIAKGDRLSLWYVVTAENEKALLNKPLQKHFRETRQLTAKHLISVHAGDGSPKSPTFFAPSSTN